MHIARIDWIIQSTMGIENNDHFDKGTNLREQTTSNNQTKKIDALNPENEIAKDRKLNKNRSVSKHQHSVSNLNLNSDYQYEDNVHPSLQNRSSEDDELEEETASDHHNRDYIQRNDLEKTDQDFRDGNNQYAENQDENDELRNGK